MVSPMPQNKNAGLRRTVYLLNTSTTNQAMIAVERNGRIWLIGIVYLLLLKLKVDNPEDHSGGKKNQSERDDPHCYQ
jgi:hypothetical protein